MSYLRSRNQFVLLNAYQSNLADVKCWLPQGSILGHLVFLIHIIDLHLAIKSSEVHSFANDNSFNLIVL